VLASVVMAATANREFLHVRPPKSRDDYNAATGPSLLSTGNREQEFAS
jgi:hypothetical protein